MFKELGKAARCNLGRYRALCVAQGNSKPKIQNSRQIQSSQIQNLKNLKIRIFNLEPCFELGILGLEFGFWVFSRCARGGTK